MKRLSILMSVAAMLAVGCYDDSQILNRMEDLEESMTSSNEEMAALKERLQELEENVYVTGVSQIMAEGSADVTGYTIALSNGESIVIRHGNDGAPGTDGLTPTVTVSGNEVLIQIGDDEPVRIPYRPAFSLNIGSGSVTVIAGATVEVPYTLTGADAATVVYAMADGGYDAEVVAESETAGKIKITAPSVYADGKVIVFAGNNVQAAMAVLSFEEGSISVTDNKIEVSKDGGAVEIPVSTNLGYQVSVSADWVSYVETRAMRNETVVLNVDPNTGLQRTATVSFMVGEMPVLEVKVVQASAVESAYSAADLVGTWTVTYNNDAGSPLTFALPIELNDSDTGTVLLKRWMYGIGNAPSIETSVAATFNDAEMTLIISCGQTLPSGAPYYNGVTMAWDSEGNAVQEIVFNVSPDCKSMTISDPEMIVGSKEISFAFKYGSNYSMTKNE